MTMQTQCPDGQACQIGGCPPLQCIRQGPVRAIRRPPTESDMIEELKALLDRWRGMPATLLPGQYWAEDLPCQMAREVGDILSRHGRQPMDTAPKDGTRILALWGEHGWQITYWHSWEERPEYRVKAGARWMPENQRCPINARPTCWQPLPSPPEAAEQKP